MLPLTEKPLPVLLAAGLVCCFCLPLDLSAADGNGETGDATPKKGLFGRLFKGSGKSKTSKVRLPSPAPSPAVPSGAAGNTVFMTEYGPMTAEAYARRLQAERERQWVATAQAREAARLVEEKQRLQAEASMAARRKAEEKRARVLAEEEERRLAEERKLAEKEARRLVEERKLAEKEERRLAKERSLAEKEARKLAEAEAREMERARVQEVGRVLEEAERLEKIEREQALQRQEEAPAEADGRETAPAPEAKAVAEAEAASPLAPAIEEGAREEKSKRKGFGLGFLKAVKGDGDKNKDKDKEREAAPASDAGDVLFVNRSQTPFFLWGPMQGIAPDQFLPRGERLILVDRGKIWSEVRLDSGEVGLVANDFVREANIQDLPVAARATGYGGTYEFHYTPLPQDMRPPALPDGPGGAATLGSSLLPSLTQ